MEGMNCDDKEGWTRVAYLNMTETGTTCPSGLTQTRYINISHDICERSNPSSGGCASTFFSTYNLISPKPVDKQEDTSIIHLTLLLYKAVTLTHIMLMVFQ